MTAASVTLLTIYDMAKALDKNMLISGVRLLSKSGGKSGDWCVRMIGIEEAQARIFALKEPVESQMVPIAEAVGRWAAQDVVALRTQPACDLSAMDGYAVRFADGVRPWTVIGESSAGRRFGGTVGADEAVRIFTGAVVPDGADTVIIQENVSRDEDRVTLSGDAPKIGRA